MPSKMPLPSEQIRQVHDAAIRANLAHSRNVLLVGINPSFTLSLPTVASPSEQILMDLMEMNRVGQLGDGTVPLVDWLNNALVLAGPRREADVFRVLLAALSGASGGGSTPPTPAEPDQVERGWGPGKKCFIGYAPEDERFARGLIKHLSPLQSSGAIALWHPGDLLAGDPRNITRSRLREADIIVFMVSPDLFDGAASRSWIEIANERVAHGARVVPVLTRGVDFQATALAAYSPLPSSGEPIIAFKPLDEAYLDIARSIRLLVAPAQGSTAAATPRVASVVVRRIDEIFSAGATSDLTYVPPEEMDQLVSAIGRTGRGLVVQGPSGSGKTTAVQKLIPSGPSWLSCIKRQDLARLDEILDRGEVTGELVIDEFHDLDPTRQRDVANLIKVAIAARGAKAKIVVIGVNNSGEALFRANTNLAGRIDLVEIKQRQPASKVRELVQKGERAANVRFSDIEALVAAARGSFILAQQLCEKALAKVPKTPETTRDIEVSIKDLTARVAADLKGSYRHRIVDFARASEARLSVLWVLSKHPDDEVSIEEVKEEFPDLRLELDDLAASRLSADHPLRQYLHVDNNGRVRCDDLQLMFYLERLGAEEWLGIARDTGLSSYVDDGALRFATKTPEGGPQQSILDLDVKEFWLRPEATTLQRLLQEAYPTLERIRHVASISGVPTENVSMAAGIATIWAQVLEAAILAATLRRLLAVVLRDETVARHHRQIQRLISGQVAAAR